MRPHCVPICTWKSSFTTLSFFMCLHLSGYCLIPICHFALESCLHLYRPLCCPCLYPGVMMMRKRWSINFAVLPLSAAVLPPGNMESRSLLPFPLDFCHLPQAVLWIPGHCWRVGFTMPWMLFIRGLCDLARTLCFWMYAVLVSQSRWSDFAEWPVPSLSALVPPA